MTQPLSVRRYLHGNFDRAAQRSIKNPAAHQQRLWRALDVQRDRLAMSEGYMLNVNQSVAGIFEDREDVSAYLRGRVILDPVDDSDDTEGIKQ